MTGWQTGPPKIKKKGQWLTGWQASPPKTKKNGQWMKSAFCISYFFAFKDTRGFAASKTLAIRKFLKSSLSKKMRLSSD